MADKDFRITYATLSADNEDLQRNYDEAVERARAELGKEWPFVVNGEERWTDEKYEEPSPIDSDIIIGRFSQATPCCEPGRGSSSRILQLKPPRPLPLPHLQSQFHVQPIARWTRDTNTVSPGS